MSLPRFAALWVILAAAPAAPPLAAAPRAAPYKGAIVMDAGSGRVLFEDGADEVSPPASMTKLMTLAVLEDRLQAGALTLQTPLTVTAADARVAMLRDSTSVWLKTGETFSVEELIYAMMIQSANDAAYMVGRTIGGSVDAFVGMMNAKAAAIGMTHTRFRTPNGLPVPSHRIADGDLTTPRDFAILSRYLILHTDVLRYTAVKTRPFGAGRRIPPTIMTNHNHLLGHIAGVDGLKTGFTNGAGFCLAATAERNGRRIIVVMMNSPDSRTRDMKVAELVNRGFASIPGPLGPVTPKPGEGGPKNTPTRPTPPPAAGPFIQFSVPSR